MRIDATIQARMGSTRLPGKVLAPVVGKPLLELQIERIRRSRHIDRVIVATTELAADDAIAALAEKVGAPCFRGAVDDVLGRVVGALRAFDVELHVEFQGDNSLPDPAVIDAIVGVYLADPDGVDYVTNALKTTFPPGLEVAVYPAAILFEAEKLVVDEALREHVGIHVYRRPDRFRVRNVEAPPELRAPHLHLEVDTPRDLEVVRAIYEHFYPRDPAFGLPEIIAFAQESGIGERNRDEPRRWRQYRDDASEKIRAAIIGCGRIAGAKQEPGDRDVASHAAAFARHDRFELVAVADRDEARAAAFAQRWAVPESFAALDDLLAAAAPDVLSVCSPTASHFDHVLAALEHAEAPRVIFVEKPVCESREQLERLRRAAGAGGSSVLVNHTRRFDPAHQRLAATIREGELGELVAGHCLYYGGWMHNGSHMVDTLRMLLGDPLDLIDVRGGAPGKPGDPCREVTLARGSAQIGLESVDEGRYQLFEIDLLFTGGRALARDFGATIVVEGATVNELDERVLAPRPDSPWAGLQSPLLHAADGIAAAIDEGRDLGDTGATLEQAAATMAILWQVTEHAASLR